MDVIDKLLNRFFELALAADARALRLDLEAREDDFAILLPEEDGPPMKWEGVLWFETSAGWRHELDYPGRVHGPAIERLVARASGDTSSPLPFEGRLAPAFEEGAPTSWQLTVTRSDAGQLQATVRRAPATVSAATGQ